MNEKVATESVWTYAYKRIILLDNQLWNFINLPHEDVYFNSYIVSRNYKILVTNEIFYIYRINNENSLMQFSQKLTIFEKIQIINKWFSTFLNWNIFDFEQCKEYWIWIFIKIAFYKWGFRRQIKLLKKKNILHPTINEIKKFFKKYKPISARTKIYFNLLLYSSFLDFLLPLIINYVHKLNIVFVKKYLKIFKK